MTSISLKFGAHLHVARTSPRTPSRRPDTGKVQPREQPVLLRACVLFDGRLYILQLDR